MPHSIRTHRTTRPIYAVLIASSVTVGALATWTAHGRGEEVSTSVQRAATYEAYGLTHAGDAQRGRALFRDTARLKCAACHRVHGRGGEIGPDLSAISGKFDRPHLIESLLEPSRQIVEGYRASMVITDDGRTVSGIIKQQSETELWLADVNAEQIKLARSKIEEITPSSLSLMPSNLADQTTVDEFVDLIAYLETLRPGGKLTPGEDIAGAVKLPPGFRIRTVATGLSGSTAMEVAPDGRVFLCEQAGALRIVENDRLMAQPFLTIDVDDFWERGLIGVTLDPQFPKEPYVYVCYVAKTPYPHHRISRFRAEGNRAAEGSERILLTGDDQRRLGGSVPAGHQGGAIHFGSDGMLYIGIGEQTAELPSQRLDTFQGKILRIARDGSVPQDNPFCQQADGKYQAIWCRGLRNPFTFAFDPVTHVLLANDVGGKYEEINRIEPGQNYGWPIVDHGPTEDSRFMGPIHFYPQASIAGGDFSSPQASWPERYRNRYYFADFVLGWIRYLDPAQPSEAIPFVEGLTRLSICDLLRTAVYTYICETLGCATTVFTGKRVVCSRSGMTTRRPLCVSQSSKFVVSRRTHVAS